MIVIIGGGYAGAATAWALARRGHGARVTLLEAEDSAGTHASGRNAGLIGSLFEEEPAMAAMAARGARLLREALGTDRSGFVPCGSVRLADEAAARRFLSLARDLDVPVSAVPTAEVARDIPLVAGAPAPVALRCPLDGKVDPARLVEGYLAAARAGGARIVTGARVTALALSRGKAAGVETTAGAFRGGWIVDAAGAWAGQLAADLTRGRLTDLGLVPCRRHLFESAPQAGLDPSWPFVWDLAQDVYFRIDGDRLTLCPCDEEPHPPAAPEVSERVREDLARKLSAALPAVAGIKLERGRACLRTFAPDRRYVIGPDVRLPGYFWVAGLGGTGATAGAAIGEMAADLLVGGEGATAGAGAPAAREFDPARLVGTPQER